MPYSYVRTDKTWTKIFSRHTINLELSGKEVHLCGCSVPRLEARASAAQQRFDDVQCSSVHGTD